MFTLANRLTIRPIGIIFTILAILILAEQAGFAQCVRIRDKRRNNAWVFEPKKDFRCLATGQSPVTPFTITFEFPVSNVTINWGDTVAFYAGPLTTATRIYKTAGIFNYTITQSGCGQQIKGIFVNDYNTSCPGVGWIAPPNDSARCLPDSLKMTNLSPGMNGFTEWIINWGDQSRDTADYPSYAKVFKHQYKEGKKICAATISITYRNSCNIIPCGQALGVNFGPYKFMEKDSAMVDNETVYMCAPTEIVVKDNSKLNCKDTVNRQIKWVAMEGFSQPLPNPGNDFWRPRGPLKNQSVKIPASFFTNLPPDSTFKLKMIIRNKCGSDTANMKIRVVKPAEPVFTVVNDGACLGTPIQFINQTPNPFGIVIYVWDFGDGILDSSNALNPTHVYLEGGNFTVKLRAITRGFGGQVCVREKQTQIFIKPAVFPRISINPSASGCDSLTTIVKNKSLSPENATWQGWSFGGNPVVTAGQNHFPGPISSDPSQVKILATNPGDSSAIVQFRKHGLYVLELRAQSQGCESFLQKDTVMVHASARHRWSLSKTNLCQGEYFTIRDSSRVISTDPRGLGSNFNHLVWTLKLGNDTTLSSNSPIITNFDSPGQTNRVHYLAFKTAGTFWVKLLVKAGDGCYKTDSIQVTVKPSAQPRFTIQKLPCNNSSLVLQNNTIGNANRYIYRIYKGNGVLIGEEYSSFTRFDQGEQPVFLPYAPPGDSTFYYVVLTAVTLTNGDSCVISSLPQLVKVAPTPVPGLAIQPSSDGCSPLSNLNILNTSLNLPQNGTVTFLWNLGSLGPFTGANPPPVTFTNPGNTNQRDTIRICVQTSDGCNYCTEKVVVTYPSPKAEINIPDSICSGASVFVTANTIGAVNFQWEFPDYDGSTSAQTSFSKIFNNLTGTAKWYKVRLIVRSAADCPLQVEKLIKVNPNPDVQIQASTYQDANCGPLHAKIFLTQNQNASQYRWHFGNGPSDTLLTTSQDTLYKVYGNETDSPIQNFVTLRATSGAGCQTQKTINFPINPLVRARFKVSIDSGCTPLRVVFTDSSTVAANIRRWIVNGVLQVGQTSQLVHTFHNNTLNDSTFTVKLAVRNNIGSNCVDTMVRKIKVFPKPRPNDLVVTPTEGCSPLKVSFQGNVQNASSFHWTFDDNTDTTLSDQSLTHTFFNSHPNNNRTFVVTRFSTSPKGCRDTTKVQVVAKPQTIAQISAINTEGCTPFTVQFSALNSVNATAYEWNFGDGSPANTSASPNYTFTNNSDSIQHFRVRLVAKKLAANTCPDTSIKIITVFPAPQAGFTTNTNIGCGPLPIHLENTSTGGILSYWVLTSGGISDTIYPGQNGTRDTIVDNPNFASKMLRVDQTVISAFGCLARASQVIQIYPNLTADFVFDSSGCQPHLVKFTNKSENHLGTYSWDFGNGASSTDKNPIHLFENYLGKDTSFLVTLTAKSPVGNCLRSKSIRVKVFATPRGSFRFLSDSSIQLPVNTITIGNQTPFRESWNYTWTFGDGTKEYHSDGTFIHTFPLGNEDFSDTNFVITMVARSPNGCADTVMKNMVIKPGHPKAEFEATPRNGCRPLEVQLTSLSSFARKYYWTVTDKEGSPPITYTERNPVFFFETAGMKTVKLMVKGLGGEDSIEKVEYIEVFETPRSSFYVDPSPPRTVVAPEEPARFTPYDSRPDFQYTWYFGDGDSSNQRTPEHRFANPGTYDITLKVVGPNGCMSIDTLKGGVIARPDQLLVAPTAFTPNPYGSNGGLVGGDGDNDVFYPFVRGVNEIILQIFNRWGQPMFESRELNVGWDGYYKGKPAPADSYVYRITALFSNGEKQTFMGDVTLLR